MKSLIPWRNKRQSTEPVLWGDDWFNNIWSNPFGNTLSTLLDKRFAAMPSVDVSEDKNEVTVRAEVPGMEEKNLNLTLHDGVLSIRGEKKNEKEDRKKGYSWRECSYGCFSRDIPVGEGVDWNGAKAKYRNGVLTVKLPKTENARKTVEIKVN